MHLHLSTSLQSAKIQNITGSRKDSFLITTLLSFQSFILFSLSICSWGITVQQRQNRKKTHNDKESDKRFMLHQNCQWHICSNPNSASQVYKFNFLSNDNIRKYVTISVLKIKQICAVCLIKKNAYSFQDMAKMCILLDIKRKYAHSL